MVWIIFVILVSGIGNGMVMVCYEVNNSGFLCIVNILILGGGVFMMVMIN